MDRNLLRWGSCLVLVGCLVCMNPPAWAQNGPGPRPTVDAIEATMCPSVETQCPGAITICPV